MPKAHVAGGEIAYESAGSGEALVFVAGLGGVGRSWQPQVAEFSRHYRVITYDQRGTGASDRRQREFSVDEERRRSLGDAPPVEVSVARIDAILAFDRRAGLHRIRAPVLIMVAQDDYITPSYHARALNTAIPGSQLRVFDSGGHSLSKTRTAEFNRAVADFLAASQP